MFAHGTAAHPEVEGGPYPQPPQAYYRIFFLGKKLHGVTIYGVSPAETLRPCPRVMRAVSASYACCPGKTLFGVSARYACCIGDSVRYPQGVCGLRP